MNLSPFRLSGLLFVFCFGLHSPVAAQKLTTTQMKLLGDGSLVWNAGSTVSRDGVAVKFELIVDTANNAKGYRFERVTLERLKSGDRIALYLMKIKYSGSFGNYRDDSGEKVFAGGAIAGAWKTVTIDSVKTMPKGIEILVKETIKLQGDKTVTKLEFGAEERGFVTDLTASEPAGGPTPATSSPPVKKPRK